ncbi:MAG: hypothetical protein NT074_07060 [Methanomicrobiales archaeon]|nr:hypothetical protein [Methanomicrobiales archaeon]
MNFYAPLLGLTLATVATGAAVVLWETPLFPVGSVLIFAFLVVAALLKTSQGSGFFLFLAGQPLLLPVAWTSLLPALFFEALLLTLTLEGSGGSGNRGAPLPLVVSIIIAITGGIALSTFRHPWEALPLFAATTSVAVILILAADRWSCRRLIGGRT